VVVDADEYHRVRQVLDVCVGRLLPLTEEDVVAEYLESIESDIHTLKQLQETQVRVELIVHSLMGRGEGP